MHVRHGPTSGSTMPIIGSTRLDRRRLARRPAVGLARPLADTRHAAWAGFAATSDGGRPTGDHSRRATLRFDTTPAVIDDPRFAVWILWESVRSRP